MIQLNCTVNLFGFVDVRQADVSGVIVVTVLLLCASNSMTCLCQLLLNICLLVGDRIKV
jgi:hypothetical protein